MASQSNQEPPDEDIESRSRLVEAEGDTKSAAYAALSKPNSENVAKFKAALDAEDVARASRSEHETQPDQPILAEQEPPDTASR